MNARIDEMRDRLGMAEAVERDLTDLVIARVDDYTIVDDGQDRWIAMTEDFDDGIDTVIAAVLDGDIDPDPQEGYQPAYDRLCDECLLLYTTCGSPPRSSIEDLLNDLDCATKERLEICEHLGLMGEDLPQMVAELDAHGTTYHGDDPIHVAQEWLALGFLADEASDWMDVGFWDPATAHKCRETGAEPQDAADAAKRLIERHGADSYTDGDPIYALCNGDLSVSDLKV